MLDVLTIRLYLLSKPVTPELSFVGSNCCNNATKIVHFLGNIAKSA